VLVDGSNTGLGGDKDNGESSDVAQQHGTTPGTASAVFHRLGYVMAGETNTTRQPAPTTNKSESKASTLSRQDTGELGNTAERLDTILGTASVTLARLSYDTDTPKRGTPGKLDMTCGTTAEETHRDGTPHGTQPPDTTSRDGKDPNNTTIRHYVPAPMRENPIQEAAADAPGLSPELPVKDGDGQSSRSEWDAGFAVLDMDGKGKITKRNEFHPVSGADFVFELLDIDGDGHITQTEYNKGFAILDKDQNGFLTRSEFGIASKLFFDMLDKEGDGKLSRKEYEAGFALMETDRNGKIDKREFNLLVRPASVFAVLDADGDGRVTRNEYEAGINLLDTDGDGVITREEFNCASGVRLAMLDKDSDGTVSRAEWNAGFVSFDTDDKRECVVYWYSI